MLMSLPPSFWPKSNLCNLHFLPWKTQSLLSFTLKKITNQETWFSIFVILLKNCLKCFSNLKNFSLLHVSVYDWFDWFYSCEGYGKNLHTWKYACNDPLNMWIACLPSITPSSSAPSGASSTKSWVYQISKITQKLGKISWLHCKIEKPLQISL